MDDCCCFQSATGISSSGTATNVDFTGITAIIDANFQIYSNNSNIVSSNISNLYINDDLLNSNISNLYYNDGLLNSNVSNLLYYNNSNISNIYYNTGYIDSNLLWWRYELLSTQAELAVTKLNVTAISTQQNILSTTVSAQGVTLAYHTGQINALEPKVTNLENNTFTKEQTSNIFVTSNVFSNVFSNVLSNTSNILANYNNLYNKPIIFTQNETSNIFITSNVLSNTSNTLADYSNLYNKPDIYTKTEIDTNIYTKIQTDTQSNLLYLDLKNYFTNNLNIIDNKNKWVVNDSNLYVLDYNIGIGKTNPNYKVDVVGSLSSTDFRFNDKQLFSLLPTDSPIFNSGISTQISSNQYYVSYTQSDTMILNKTYTIDILLVGAGGRGGLNAFAGGGGAGEVVYITNYSLPAGIYNIDIGIDSSTVANRITRLKQGVTDLITVNGGGDGAGFIETLTNTNASYFVNTLTTAVINKQFSVPLTTNANNNITFTVGLININSTLHYQYLPITTASPYLWCKFLGDINDSSANAYNLASVGNPTIGTNTVTFAAGKYLTFNSSANMNPYTIWNNYGISFSFWFKATSSTASGAFLFTFSENTTQFKYIGIYKESLLTSIAFIVYGNPANNYIQYRATANNFFNNTWYHLAWTISSSGDWRIYINGSLVSSDINCTLPTGTYPLRYLGRAFNSTNAIIGDMKDFRIYRSVITQSDVTEIYKGRVDIVRNATSGGSGGGGNDNPLSYLITNSASSGTPFNPTYSKLTNGYDSISGISGGNGGNALLTGRYTDLISGIQVGAGGSGATNSSTPVTKTNYGDGGDGNGGNARQGIVIMKFTGEVITKFLEYTDYNKLFNKPNLLSQEETSNIFITSNVFSNVLSNTSNTLANYNNLYNKPDIYTKTQIDNNIYTKTQSDTNYYTKANVYTKTESDNNYYNKTLVYTKTESDNNYYTKTQSDNNYYNKSQIDVFNSYRPMTSNITQKLTGSILSLTLVSGGSGYASFLTNQPLTFTGGGGQNASGTYNTDGSGSVNSITLTDGGILYTSTAVQVKAGTGNAVISATMGYFDFHNIYSALNVNGKPDIVYKRCDLAFGTRDPTGISYQESPDGLAGALGTNGFCGLRVKDERMFLIANSNLIQTSFENNYVGARKNIFLTAQTSNIELMCSSVNAEILMKSRTTFEKEVIFTGGVSKKIPKYFTTSRIASFDGIQCLAFDINLQTNGVNTTTILGYVFRMFRISFFFVTKAPRFQWTPRTYEIHMSSFDANSVSAFDGYSAYSSLDKSYNYQWFLYRQNFSQITFCCPTALFGTTHLDVGFVLEDLLAI